ncbi:MAG: type VI secretion system protein TssA [Silvanigrellaceae bacterium]|nr:type VI secretion system protein TssA [Silvanigrellaceae bacterium]
MVQEIAVVELDFEALLAPISPEKLEGEPTDLVESFGRIKQIRSQNDQIYKDEFYLTPEEQSQNWLEIQALCLDILQKHSKDLNVAGFLLEARLHLYDYDGLISGLSLFYELCQKYWEQVYPKISEEGLDGRSIPFEWINNKISTKMLYLLPVTFPNKKGFYKFNYYEWDKVKRKEKSNNASDKDISQYTLEDFHKSSLETSPSFFTQSQQKIQEIKKLLKNFNNFFTENEITNYCNFNQLKGALEKIAPLLQTALETKQKASLIEPSKEMVGEGVNQVLTNQKELYFSHRSQAYAKLKEIIEFFKKNEPHSPTPLVLSRVLAWEHKSISDILDELIQSPEEKGLLFHILGVKSTTKPESRFHDD